MEFPVFTEDLAELGRIADSILGYEGTDSYEFAFGEVEDFEDPEGREEVLIDDIDCELWSSGYLLTSTRDDQGYITWRIDRNPNRKEN